MKKNLNYIYALFSLIIMFSFNIEVNAAKELSCLYENSPAADKVMLVQKKDGTLIVYKNKKNAGWEDLEWYIAKAIPRWGDTKVKNGKIKIDDSNTDNDVKISNLTSCPTAKITLNNGGLRFYKEQVSGMFKGTKYISYLEDSMNKVFIPSIYEYDTTNKNFEGKTCNSITVEQKWNSVKEKHDTMCLYSKDVKEGCHVILLAIDKNKSLHIRQSEPLANKLSAKAIKIKSNTDSVNVEEIFGSFTGNCPDSIYVSREVTALKNGQAKGVSSIVHLVNTPGIVKKEAYYRDDQSGENIVTGGKLENKIEITFKKINILDCDDLFGDSEELKNLLKYCIILLKVLVPVLLIGLGSVDFAKAVFSGSEDNMKKTQNKFIKRVIIAIAIFLVPTLLKLILTIGNGIWDNIDATLCGLL